MTLTALEPSAQDVNLQTRPNYFYNRAGDLRLIDDSDPAMTDVTTTRDARGRVATVVDAAGTRTFTHTAAGLPLSESTAAGRVMTWDYDAAGRKAGYALWENGAWQTWSGWGYDGGTGKMTGVTTREGWVSGTRWRDDAHAKARDAEHPDPARWPRSAPRERDLCRHHHPGPPGRAPLRLYSRALGF